MSFPLTAAICGVTGALALCIMVGVMIEAARAKCARRQARLRRLIQLRDRAYGICDDCN